MNKKSIGSLIMSFILIFIVTVFNAQAAEPEIFTAYDAQNSTATEKVIEFGCSGMDDGIATYRIKINIPEDAAIEAESPFGQPLSNISDGYYIAAAMSAMNIKCDNGVFLTIKISLKEELDADFNLVLTECTVSDDKGHKVPYETGQNTVLLKSNREGAQESTAKLEATEEPAVTQAPSAAAEPAATARPASSSGGRSGGGSSSGSSSSGSSAAAAGTPKPTLSPEKEMWIEPSGDKSVLIIVRYQNGKLSSVEKKRYEGKDRIDMSGFGLKQDDRIYLFDAASGVLSQKILAEKE